MKKTKVILLLFILFYTFVGCSNTTTNGISSTADNTSPQSVLKRNPNADIFIMDSIVYVKATDIGWVKKLKLNEGKILGKINKTGVKKEFKNWNATKLDVGTEIYESKERNDIVLVKIKSKYIPYFMLVEG